jgi:hypoxanthine phosphoribosyltransferase
MVSAREAPEVLLSQAQVAEKVKSVARRLAPLTDEATVAVCLLTGGLWFAADLTRALARLGRFLAFDALWLASYGDDQTSGGDCEVRAGLQRPLARRRVLIIDDVIDTGLSLAQAARLIEAAGASEIRSVVFARKPWPGPRAMEPDFVAWEAPPRFLVGYGMDKAGRFRGLPYVGAGD